MVWYYAVRVGRRTGIFEDWEQARPLVEGFSGAEHKKFKFRGEAEEYLRAGGRPAPERYQQRSAADAATDTRDMPPGARAQPPVKEEEEEAGGCRKRARAQCGSRYT